MIRLESAGYRLTVDPALGGAVRSLRWQDIDILRPAAETDKDPLLMASFPLVPFSNRIAGPIEGSAGPLLLPRYMDAVPHPIHGFGWQLAWQIADSGPDHLHLVLEDRASPWFGPYRAEQMMHLDAAGFHCSIVIENIGSEALPAGIGFHPYFRRSDCILTIAAGAMWSKDDRDIPVRATPTNLLGGGPVALENVRLDHSFSGWDGIAKMEWPSRNLATTLSASPSLRELVIYCPDEDIFCLEPVSHLTNAAAAASPKMQRGWRILAPHERLTGSMSISARALP